MNAILSLFTLLFESVAAAHCGIEIVSFKRFSNLIKQLPHAFASYSPVFNTYISSLCENYYIKINQLVQWLGYVLYDQGIGV